MANQPDDQAFREALLDDDLVICSELDELQTGGEGSLPQQVLQAGFLTVYQIKSICRNIEALPLVCMECKGRFRVPKERAADEFRCPHCSVQVGLKNGTCGLNEILINNPPLHLTNQVLLKLGVKFGIVIASEGEALRVSHANRVPPVSVETAIREACPNRTGDIDLLRKKCDESIRKKYPRFDELIEDVELALFLARHNLVSIQVLNDSLSRQLLQAEQGEALTLRGLLHDLKQLTPYQISSYLPRCFDQISRRTWAMNRDPLERIHARNILDQFDSDETINETDLFDQDTFQEAVSRELQVLSLDGPDEEPEDEKSDPDDFRPGDMMKKYVEGEYKKPSSSPPEG